MMPQINGISHGTARTNPSTPQTTTLAEAEGTEPTPPIASTLAPPSSTFGIAATVGEIDGFNHIKTIIPDAEVRFDRLPMSDARA